MCKCADHLTRLYEKRKEPEKLYRSSIGLPFLHRPRCEISVLTLFHRLNGPWTQNTLSSGRGKTCENNPLQTPLCSGKNPTIHKARQIVLGVGHCWRPKLADCADRSDRSDWSRWLCQNANWTSPLRSSRRGNQNAYVERLIWSSDERVIASGRLDTGSDRSDRSKLHSPSLELYFDVGFVWN